MEDGWLSVQRNKKDGVNNFNKKWKDYEEGYGDLNGDKLWYGLKALNCFTETGQWELRIDFQFDNKTWSHLHYKQFKVGSSNAEYPLTIGGFTGTKSLNRMRLITTDNDNDQYGSNCAALGSSGGWWHNNCYYINPNYQPPQVYLNSKWYNLHSV